MRKFRILVVDDSAFMRAIIQDLIMKDPAFEIAGTAASGREAVEAAARLQPDAMTLDLEMPEMNGLEALSVIMEQSPLPVIMFSGISEENTYQTISALQEGALDFIRKPSPSSPPGEIGTIGRLLREKLHVAGQLHGRLKRPLAPRSEAIVKAPLTPPKRSVRSGVPEKEVAAAEESRLKRASGTDVAGVSQQSRPEVSRNKAAPVPAPAKPANADRAAVKKPEALEKPSQTSWGAVQAAPLRDKWSQLIAIGTSTGGPRALHEVISGLPAELPAPVLVVQHMPPRFTASLAKRLNAFSAVEVTEAQHGDRVYAGHVYIAPGGSHMELAKGDGGYTIRLTTDPPTSGHRPSVDVLFHSLVHHTELERHAVLLTGMGSDGAKGMLELRSNGVASTITESEETCVVYGMPRSAVENGSSQMVLPLHRIAEELAERCRTGRSQ